jgi:hypothetical protein
VVLFELHSGQTARTSSLNIKILLEKFAILKIRILFKSL